MIVVYRSPILWILPLFSALMAESFAGAVIYILAKNNIITLDGQSQGILSVLVIGAATDYALLLIARYREAGLVVTTDLYPDARHEVFNETNRAEVVERFAAWLGTVRRRTRP